MPSGSKPISGFQNGTPPQAADDYVFERAGVTYRIPYASLQAAIISAVGTVATTPVVLFQDSETEDSIPIPGERGPAGIGTPGASGRDGNFILMEADSPEDPFIIPGQPGIQGIQGTIGLVGRNGDVIVLEPDAPDDPFVIPGASGSQGIQGFTGLTGRTGDIILLEPEMPDDPAVIPGERGVQGSPGVGLTGASGAIFTIDPESPDDPQVIPGSQGIQGIQGIQGNTGAAGRAGDVIISDPDSPDDIFPIPGERGAQGNAGTAGIQGKDGAIILPEEIFPDDVQVVPGRDGAAGSVVNTLVTSLLMLTEEHIIDGYMIPGPAGAAGAGGGVSDGDKGDITVSVGGTVWTVDNAAITYAKMQNVSASRLLGNPTVGAAAPSEIIVSTGLSLTSSLSVSLSNASAFATAQTTVALATYADITGCSVSLAPGTWIIWAQIVHAAVNLAYQGFFAITTGAGAVQSEVAGGRVASGTAALQTPEASFLMAIVVNSTGLPATYKLQAARGLTTITGSFTVMDGNGVNTANHLTNNTDKGTGIFALRIA